jgi:hypothetical protein
MFSLPVPAEFRRRILETMDRYPRDTRPLRVLFNYASLREPAEDDIVLIDLALRRLPFLLETDPDLAWMAAPFIADTGEARRLVGAYRTGALQAQPGDFRPAPESIVPALNLGLLFDIDAVDELMGAATLDKHLLVNVSNLLRTEEGRNHLAQKLHSFTGVITEDEDRDGIPENNAVFRDGVLLEYLCDDDQDGIAELVVSFASGLPRQAEITALPTAGSGGDRVKALIQWERYPSVQQVTLGSETYLYAPGGFQYTPVIFEELCATETYTGLFFPRHNLLSPGISRRMLSAFAVSVRRPSVEFEGGIEHLYLDQGIPVRAEVIVNNLTVSITEFANGSPVIQRLDLDHDGRMETVRRFRSRVPVQSADELLDYRHLVESSESDWDGDGIFEYRELYREDGSIVY